MRILLADDHTLVREDLKKIMKEDADLEAVCEASRGQEGLNLMDKTKLDLVVLDITTPGMSCQVVLKEIKLRHPSLAVLMLTMHPEDRFGVQAFRAGAAAYLTKEKTPRELITAIRTITKGGKYVTPSLEKLV